MEWKADGTNQDTDLTPEAFAEHFKTEHFAILGKTISEEGLLAVPLDIKKVNQFAGFGGR
jgi:hypothetical protein